MSERKNWKPIGIAGEKKVDREYVAVGRHQSVFVSMSDQMKGEQGGLLTFCDHKFDRDLCVNPNPNLGWDWLVVVCPIQA